MVRLIVAVIVLTAVGVAVNIGWQQGLAIPLTLATVAAVVYVTSETVRVMIRDRQVNRRTVPIVRPVYETREAEIAALAPWVTEPADTIPNLRSVPVARDAFGDPWNMQVLGSHTLVIGATGAGKGSVLWSLVTQLAPGVKSGLVELWGIDPKSGIELGFGENLFTRFIADAIDDDGQSTWETDLAEAVADARRAMSERANKMRGKSRLHTPTTNAPLVVIIIDEYLALTIGVQDKTLAKQIDIDLKMILTQGRAAGYAVIALAQIAQRNVIGIVRDLFPVRVMLRIPDKVQVTMVLGPEALNAGADAHKIPIDMPGVAYVMEDGETEPRLVRFPWVSDNQVTLMARDYQPPIKPTVPVHVRAPQLQPPPQPVTAPQPVLQLEPATKLSKRDAVTNTITEHPDWSNAQVEEATGATNRYVRMIRNETGVVT